MIKYFLCGVLAVALSGPAVAQKPAWAGEGKPGTEQKAAHKEAMKARYDSEMDDAVTIKKDKKVKKEKKEKMPYAESDSGDEAKGLEKQRLKKMEQERKELGKGSQAGQDGREESRKWWKFWE